MSLKKTKSLRSKFVRILLVVSSLIGIATTCIVVLMSAQASDEYFASVEQHIREGIISKGRVLTQNHALALRGLTQDNAFLDIQGLVVRAVRDDQDLAYGIFINSERVTLAKSQRGDAIAQAGDKTGAPEREAWRSLGLREDELLVSSQVVQRKSRLGQDLLEVAVPVVSEEGEALGTVRYGLSTRRMHEALAHAKRDSSARLWRSVLWIIALVSVVTVLGLLLSRAQAVRITKPIGELTRAAEALASGDRSVRVSIHSGDELSMLGDSFNHMVEELAGSYQALQQLNHTLEQKVEARTAELALANRDMRLVLDNVDQGFVTLSPDGTMAGERSAVVNRWFGDSTPRDFASYIGELSPDFGSKFGAAWSQIQDGFLPLEVCLDQLPAQLSVAGRTWSFRYLPFSRGGELEGVLLVIADVTERLLREREEADQNELMQAFKKLILDRNGFTFFMRDTDAMLARITATGPEADLPLFKRTLHTLKGNAGVMGLTVVARLCHSLESQLAEEGHEAECSLADLHRRWNTIRDHVSQFLGSSGQRVIEVPEAEYLALFARLESDHGESEVVRQLRTWQLEPAARWLTRLADEARVLAQRLGKGDIDVGVSAEGVRLDPRPWAPFFAELLHVVRNAVDHGLETASERTAAGKPLQGKLLLRAHTEKDVLTFEVTDDGRGIDWQSVAERAKRLGLPHASQADLLTAVCTDGVTTCDTATETSGRGVGMSAFQQRVKLMQGRLEVRSTGGSGTSFFVRFPASATREIPKPAADTKRAMGSLG